MSLPSGLQAGASSVVGPVVTARGVKPGAAGTTKMSEFSLASGSAVRLLVKASQRPSGDQAGWLSS